MKLIFTNNDNYRWMHGKTIIPREYYSFMSHYRKPVRIGTWFYEGTAVTGVRIIEGQIAFGTGDEEDPPELRDDRDLNCFYVEWAVAGSTTDWRSCGNRPFQTLAEAESYVAVQSNGTVRWQK